MDEFEKELKEITISKVVTSLKHPVEIEAAIIGMTCIATTSHGIKTISQLPGSFRLEHQLHIGSYVDTSRIEHTQKMIDAIKKASLAKSINFIKIELMYFEFKRSDGTIIDERDGKLKKIKHLGIVVTSHGINLCPLFEGEEQALYPLKATPHGFHMSRVAVGGSILPLHKTMEEDIQEFNIQFMSVGFGYQAVIGILTL